MTLILSGTNGVSDIDGDASTPAVRGTDANTGIFFGSDVIGFSEGGTECARFNADAQFVAAAGTASLPVLTTTGDVNTGIYFPAADNIGFATGGTIRGRWTTDGLCFGSDTAAANALDDYEEGTWTPTDASGAGLTFSSAYGYYIKVGRVVYVQAKIIYPSTANGSNNAIGGLPFNINTNSPYNFPIGVCSANGDTDASKAYGSGTTAVFINSSDVVSTNAALSTANINFNMTYIAV